MSVHLLDNPIWNALTSAHSHVAVGDGQVRRYPPTIAPFAAMDVASEEAEAQLRSIVSPGEKVCVLSVAPRFSDCWEVLNEVEIVQMVWEGPLPDLALDLPIVQLERGDYPAMLELTALVYPAYFREGTATLGDYFGILEGGMLCAMAGIRMAMDGYQEISAVCTHPDFRGRGYARGLMAHLVRHIQQRGDVPFLHTELENEAAQALYRSLGFRVRVVLPFWVVGRR